MLEGPYSDAEIGAAVEALASPERLAGAQATVARFAAQLEPVLDRALDSGGWFGSVHEAGLTKAAALEASEERVGAIRLLVAEETRLGMMVGVAVGIELARELAKHPSHHPKEN